MKRGDTAILSISAALSGLVAAAVAFSLFVVDRAPVSDDRQPGPSTSSFLVITWAPTLCKARPDTIGCADGHIDALGQTFLLHGLWPQPPDEQFCGVSRTIADRVRHGDNAGLSEPSLPRALQARLGKVVSDVATVVSHEWYRHGTCSGVAPADYFSDAASLTEQVRTVLDPVFKTAQGQELSLETARAAVDSTFGPGAGDRVSFVCSDLDGYGVIVYEVRLSLPPVAGLRAGGEGPDLADLIGKAPVKSGGCRRGRVV